MNPAPDPSQRSSAASIAALPRQSAPAWATLIATFLGIGRLRPGPGTWASAVTVLLWAAVAHVLKPELWTPVAIGLAIVIALIGIPAATTASRAMAAKDPQIVVIDEVAGQMVALIAAPLSWKTLLVSFILFRMFDILKPPPVRQLEKLPEGTGIMVDDLAAGLYALIVMQLLLRSGLLR